MERWLGNTSPSYPIQSILISVQIFSNDMHKSLFGNLRGQHHVVQIVEVSRPELDSGFKPSHGHLTSAAPKLGEQRKQNSYDM